MSPRSGRFQVAVLVPLQLILTTENFCHFFKQHTTQRRGFSGRDDTATDSHVLRLPVESRPMKEHRDQLRNLWNLYWHLRCCRNDACRRRWYRKIAVEKKRLLAAGVSHVELHLVCRVATNPRNPNARDRLRSYYAQGSLLDGWHIQREPQPGADAA